MAVKEITDRISPKDIAFEMIVLNGGGEESTGQFGNVKVHRLFNKVGIIEKLLYPFVAYRRATQLHKENHYDLVWSIMASYAGFAGFLFKRKHPEVRHVLTIQEGDHFERRHGLLKPFFKWIFTSADHIQSISNFLADWSREMGAVCPITVVPNAVDYELFSNITSEEDILNLRKDMGFGKDDKILITTSRLVEKNAVGDIIESLKYLPGNVKFVVLGVGPDEETLKKKAVSLGLADRVKFLGFISHSDMPKYLHASDIFIRPSLTEGLGNSFLEAMAAGVPVVATPVGGIPDFLQDGETGLFCEVRNPRSIAQKVEKFLKDKESREYIVRNAKEMVLEKYKWERVAILMKSILNVI